MWRGLPQLGHGPGEGGPEGPPRGRQAPHQPEKPQGRRPWDQHRHLWDSPAFQRHRAVCGSLTRKAPRFPSALSVRTPTLGPPGQAGRRTHPLGGRNPEAVLLHVETAGGAHLCDEVQVPSVLRLPTLAPLELPDEVEEAAGQEEEAAAVGRPAKTTSSTETERPE